MLLYGEDGRAWESTPSTVIPLSRAMGERRFLLYLHVWDGQFGVEVEHVLLNDLGVRDEEALGARDQRTICLNIRMAARDVASEVVEVL